MQYHQNKCPEAILQSLRGFALASISVCTTRLPVYVNHTIKPENYCSTILIKHPKKEKITAGAVIFRGANVYRHLLRFTQTLRERRGLSARGAAEKTVHLHVVLGAEMRGISHLQFYYNTRQY